MPTVRNDQMAAFQTSAERDFEDRILALVRRQNTGIPPGTSEERLREMVVNGIRRARSHGLTAEQPIGKFVGLMFGIAPNFDQYPPVRAILADPRVEPNRRVQALLDGLTTQQWTGAARRYDLAAWDPPAPAGPDPGKDN